MTAASDLALEALGYVVLERTGEGAFVVAGPAPPGYEGLFGAGEVVRPGEASAFLDWFLREADPVWAGEREGPLASGPWAEEGADGVRRTLEATALRLDGRSVLLVGPPRVEFGELQRLLQAARVLALRAESERQTWSEREVLLHCIVHDLANPLSGISGSLQLLSDRDLDEDDAELLEIASRNVGRMRGMIQSVLHTFEAEVAALLPSATPTADAAAVLAAAAAAIGPQATVAGVALEAEAPSGPLLVGADAVRLERVLLNFLDNALRHTPAGGHVRLVAEPEAGAVRLVVEDDGPGVPEEAVAHLFRKFSQGDGAKGRIGLGLYFCKIAAEGWGGAVGYERSPMGGAQFWVRLPRAEAGDA